MASTLPRRASGKAATRFQLRSSHKSRFRLAVSHRGSAWAPPRKDDAAAERVNERDLRSAFGDAGPRPKRQRG